MTDPSSASAAESSPAIFRLKGGLFPLTTLEFSGWQREGFLHELQAKVAEAPAFFQDAPVILALDALPESVDVPLQEVVSMCRAHGMLPVGVRGGGESLQATARELGLARLPVGRSRPTPQEPRARPDSTEPQLPEPQPSEPKASPSRVVTNPVRSGQQVYAAGGDLIVLSSVSEGAEVLADGNIHVYGPLRGRALAGVRGDAEARIFCQSLEAELVSIAGDFKLHEDLQSSLWRQAVQIYLDEQTLRVAALA